MEDGSGVSAVTGLPVSSPGARVARTLGLGVALLTVLLVVSGQVLFLIRSVRSGTWTTAHVAVTSTGTLRHRLAVTLDGALGGSDRGAVRFSVTHVRRAGAGSPLSVVHVRWSINNDLSAGTVGNGAQADAYTIFRDLYTAHLPLAQVFLTGTFRMPSHGRMRESVVMKLGMSNSTAAMVADAGWDTFDPQSFWPLVTRYYVNTQLQPLSPE